MLIKEDEMSKRLNNPLNLINQMKSGFKANKRADAMSLFIKPEVKKELNPFIKPEIVKPVMTTAVAVLEPIENPIQTDDVIADFDAKAKLALAHDNALEVMTRAINIAGSKLDDVKAEKLPGMIVAMSKVVGNIRAERIEREKVNKGNDVHLHFYCPEQKKVEQYQVIEVAS